MTVEQAGLAEKIDAAVDAYIELLNSGTAEQIADLYAADATVEDPIGADIRDTREQAWRDAEAKVAKMAQIEGAGWHDHRRVVAEGQQRLLDLQAQGEVLDENLYTTPGKFGAGGAATTWLVGTADEVAQSLRRYAALGITRFILSDTPYLREIVHQGQALLPLLRNAPAEDQRAQVDA